MSTVGIVGPGRAGLALGRALSTAGHTVHVHGRREHTVPPPLVASWGETPPWMEVASIVLLAVPDAAIGSVARRVPVSARHAVFHLAGPLGVEALAPLRDSGAALGAFHPLLGLRGTDTDPVRFKGAIVALDGDERALETGRLLADSLRMVPVHVPGPARARYHAGAVFAANYLVALAGAAERLMTEAGLPAEIARRGIARLMESAIANVASAGPVAALTGPIARGDVATVARHLEALDGTPEEGLYRALARETLRFAKLDPGVRAEIERLTANE